VLPQHSVHVRDRVLWQPTLDIPSFQDAFKSSSDAAEASVTCVVGLVPTPSDQLGELTDAYQLESAELI
jgi:hypothetical protein